MKLTKADIQQFKELYQKYFGELLNDQQAQEQALHCLHYAQFELKPNVEVSNGK